MRRRTTKAGALVVLAGLLAGCAEPAEPADLTGAWGGQIGPRQVGPLQWLVETNGGLTDPASDSFVTDYIAMLAAKEDQIAACMEAAGFEYWPQVPTTESFHDGSVGVDPTTREFAAVYGFRFAESLPEDVLGEVAYGSGSAEAYDYVESLSAAARELYDEAYYGPPTNVVKHPDGSVSSDRAGGCLDQARDEVRFSVVDEAREYLETITQEGDFDAANLAWSVCMRDAGFTYTSPAAAEAAIVDEVFTERVLLPEAEQAESVARERAVAVASWDCRDTTGYDEAAFEVRTRLEQAWIDEHQAELQAWVESLAAR